MEPSCDHQSALDADEAASTDERLLCVRQAHLGRLLAIVSLRRATWP